MFKTNDQYMQTAIATGLVASSIGYFHTINKNPGNEYVLYHLPIAIGATLLMPQLSKNFFQPATEKVLSLITEDKQKIESAAKFVDSALNNTALCYAIMAGIYGLNSGSKLPNVHDTVLKSTMSGGLGTLLYKVSVGDFDNMLKDVGGSFTGQVVKRSIEHGMLSLLPNDMQNSGQASALPVGQVYGHKLGIQIVSTLSGTFTKHFIKGSDGTTLTKGAVSDIINNLLYDMNYAGKGLRAIGITDDLAVDVLECGVIETGQPYLDHILFDALKGLPQEPLMASPVPFADTFV